MKIYTLWTVVILIITACAHAVPSTPTTSVIATPTIAMATPDIIEQNTTQITSNVTITADCLLEQDILGTMTVQWCDRNSLGYTSVLAKWNTQTTSMKTSDFGGGYFDHHNYGSDGKTFDVVLNNGDVQRVVSINYDNEVVINITVDKLIYGSIVAVVIIDERGVTISTVLGTFVFDRQGKLLETIE